MKLRDHPLMSYRGVINWPPVWVKTGTSGAVTVTGEVGILVYVHANPAASNQCFLVTDVDGDTYVGTLIFGDKAFCKQISEILKTHLGWFIDQIGDLDLSQTL